MPPKKRRYTRRKIVRYIPSRKQLSRILEVKELYDKYGTLQEVADHLNLTRERVRQILNKGQHYKLFKYELTREKRLNELLMQIKKEDIITAIKEGLTTDAICLKFEIDLDEYSKIIHFYQISTQDYIADARYRRWLAMYSSIVDALGHHPSTTEMQSRPKWRILYNVIDRKWEGIDNFRREFGIEKPPFAIHPNTRKAFARAIERNKILKEEKINNVKNIVANYGPISLREIIERTGYKYVTASNYLKILCERNVIKKDDSERAIKYFT